MVSEWMMTSLPVIVPCTPSPQCIRGAAPVRGKHPVIRAAPGRPLPPPSRSLAFLQPSIDDRRHVGQSRAFLADLKGASFRVETISGKFVAPLRVSSVRSSGWHTLTGGTQIARSGARSAAADCWNPPPFPARPRAPPSGRSRRGRTVHPGKSSSCAVSSPVSFGLLPASVSAAPRAAPARRWAARTPPGARGDSAP